MLNQSTIWMRIRLDCVTFLLRKLLRVIVSPKTDQILFLLELLNVPLLHHLMLSSCRLRLMLRLRSVDVKIILGHKLIIRHKMWLRIFVLLKLLFLLHINALNSCYWIKVSKQYQLGGLNQNLCLLLELFFRYFLILINLLKHSCFNAIHFI